MCINNNNNNNNAIINNNYGRLHGIILLFKFPMGTRKGFLEIYNYLGTLPHKDRQRWYEPSEYKYLNLLS
jgi:hypothetical protein